MTRNTTTRNPESIIEMFVDATSGESYADNRMITTETDSGSVALIGFGWLRLAEYNESEGIVTVYLGHKSMNSRTVSRWLNKIMETASDRRSVEISHESPYEREPNDAVRYVNNYITYENMSPVEKDAYDAVRKSLEFLNRFL